MKMIHATWTPIFTLVLLAVGLEFGNTSIHAQERAAELPQVIARGVKLYQEGRTQEAIEALRNAVKQNPKEANAWHYLGLALYSEGAMIEARKAFEKALVLRPNHPADRVNLAHTLFLANKPKEAAREAEQALKAEPQNVEAHYIIGAVCLKVGDLTKALAEAETILRLQPNFARAYLLKSMAQVGFFTREYGQATSQLHPNLTPEEKDNLRRAHYSSLKDAAENLATYLKLDTNGQEASLWRGQLEGLQTYAQAFDPANDKSSVMWAGEGIKPTVTYKERAKYTRAAQVAGVTGTVLLMAIFAADGQIKTYHCPQWTALRAERGSDKSRPQDQVHTRYEGWSSGVGSGEHRIQFRILLISLAA